MSRFAAVYTDRSDNDWDLCAVFDSEANSFEEMTSQASGAKNAAEQYAHELEHGGHHVETKIVWFDRLDEIPDVWEGKSDDKG